MEGEQDEIAKQAAKAKQLYGLKKKSGTPKEEAGEEVYYLYRDLTPQHTLERNRCLKRKKEKAYN